MISVQGIAGECGKIGSAFSSGFAMKLDSPASDERSFLTFKATSVYFNKAGSFCRLGELAAHFGYYLFIP